MNKPLPPDSLADLATLLIISPSRAAFSISFFLPGLSVAAAGLGSCVTCSLGEIGFFGGDAVTTFFSVVTLVGSGVGVTGSVDLAWLLDLMD